MSPTSLVITGSAWRAVWALAMWMFTIAGFFSVVSFLTADPPVEIPPASSVDLPSAWPAAVRNHGNYYLWWTVSQRPLMFAISVAFLLYGLITLCRVQRLSPQVEEQSAPAVAVRVAVTCVLVFSVAMITLIFFEIVLGWNLIGWPTTY